MIKTYNQLIMCEPYKGSRGIKAKITSGVAVIQQKLAVIGLKVLQDAVISDKLTISAGETVFIKEEILHTYRDQYSQAFECTDISTPFTLVNFGHVAFIKGK